MNTKHETTGTINDTIKDFVEKLRDLDNGDIAILKRNPGNTIASSRGVSRIIYRLLPGNVLGRWEEEAYYLIATLYGLNKDDIITPPPADFGKTMLKVREYVSTENIDRRFAILLDSDFNASTGSQAGEGELPYRLRQCVKLANSKKVKIDWEELTLDILSWNKLGKPTQKKWARSYFGDKNIIEESKANKTT